jgi:hypothetical protein
MDSRRKDKDGLTICPQCERHYTPELGERQMAKNPGKCIQDIYPNAKPYQREQLVTGLCSDACWDNYLGAQCREDEVIISRQAPRPPIVTPEDFNREDLAALIKSMDYPAFSFAVGELRKWAEERKTRKDLTYKEIHLYNEVEHLLERLERSLDFGSFDVEGG